MNNDVKLEDLIDTASIGNDEELKASLAEALQKQQSERRAAEHYRTRPSRARRWGDTAKTVVYCGASYGLALAAVGVAANLLWPSESEGE